jgi:hypothetical protein
MMKMIYKYQIGTVQIPKGAKILTANRQGDDVVLWAEVDTTTDREHRTFRVFGTGFEIPEGSTYINTFFDGPFVWHLYEVQE